MGTNHWFYAKKPPTEVNGKLCPRRLMKEFSVSLNTTAPQNRELEFGKKAAMILFLTHSFINYCSIGKEK